MQYNQKHLRKFLFKHSREAVLEISHPETKPLKWRWLSGVIFFLLISFHLSSQVYVQFDIQTNESSFSSANIWTVNVLNGTPNYFECYLKAVISVQGEGVIGEGISRSFKLYPYKNELYVKNTQSMFDSVGITYFGSYRDGVTRTGELPSRSYTVCVELVSVFNGNLITKTCVDKQIQKYQPPVNFTAKAAKTKIQVSAFGISNYGLHRHLTAVNSTAYELHYEIELL